MRLEQRSRAQRSVIRICLYWCHQPLAGGSKLIVDERPRHLNVREWRHERESALDRLQAPPVHRFVEKIEDRRDWARRRPRELGEAVGHQETQPTRTGRQPIGRQDEKDAVVIQHSGQVLTGVHTGYRRRNQVCILGRGWCAGRSGRDGVRRGRFLPTLPGSPPFHDG